MFYLIKIIYKYYNIILHKTQVQNFRKTNAKSVKMLYNASTKQKDIKRGEKDG